MNKISDFSFQISTISVDADSTTLNMEAQVGKYGNVYLSITLLSSSSDRDTGTYIGEARTITAEGDMIAASLQMFWISAPENPGVRALNFLEYSSLLKLSLTKIFLR